MKSKKITTLALILSLCSGIAVHAATVTPSNQSANSVDKKVECKHKNHEGKKHFGMFMAAKQMGIEKKDFEEAKKNNKNFFDLAKQKGYSEQQARDIIIKTKTEAINKKVSEGKLTKEKADEILKNIKEKIAKWDGTLRSKKEPDKDNTKAN